MRSSRNQVACAALLVALALPLPAAAEVTIRLSGKQNSQVEVAGLPATSLAKLGEKSLDLPAWQQILTVHVAAGAVRNAPPMLGEYLVIDDALVFKPRFPLKPGLRYRVKFDAAALTETNDKSVKPLEAILSTPALPAAVPTVVTKVYPTSDVLPENLLKLYLHFSAPMSRGDSYRHIQLLDAAGEAVELPFLELAEELWDDSGRRLTVLFDPGRIKRDLVPHNEVGPPIRSGEAYVLAIDAAWRDASGQPLAENFRKTFRVAAFDDRQPDPARWQLHPPAAESRDPLVVLFDEPLDHAMLQRAIQVADAGGMLLDGEIRVDDHETRWSFRPANHWQAGTYQLRVDSTLEDLAGNSPGRPFEVGPATAPAASAEHLAVPFVIGSTTESPAH